MPILLLFVKSVQNLVIVQNVRDVLTVPLSASLQTLLSIQNYANNVRRVNVPPRPFVPSVPTAETTILMLANTAKTLGRDVTTNNAKIESVLSAERPNLKDVMTVYWPVLNVLMTDVRVVLSVNPVSTSAVSVPFWDVIVTSDARIARTVLEANPLLSPMTKDASTVRKWDATYLTYAKTVKSVEMSSVMTVP